MRNERLMRAMLTTGLDADGLARAVRVSPASVHRWLEGTTLPFPQTRHRVAAAVRESETFLWPENVDPHTLANAELITAWPRRSDLPARLWMDLMRAAGQTIDLFAFTGPLLTEDPREWTALLREKAGAGTRVRVLLRDPDVAPDGEAVPRIEGASEGGIEGKGTGVGVGAVLAGLRGTAGRVGIALQDTPAYNSLYRFDDQVLVNLHLPGIPAARSPILQLRRVDGSLVDTYLESFEWLWAHARPLPATRR